MAFSTVFIGAAFRLLSLVIAPARPEYIAEQEAKTPLQARIVEELQNEQNNLKICASRHLAV